MPTFAYGGLLGWIALATAALTGIAATWHKVVRPVVHGITDTADAVKGLRALLEPDEAGRTIPDQLGDLKRQVAVIDERSKQLEPNGGNSLYDRVGKLERGQAKAQRQQVLDMKTLAPMVETIAALSGPPRRTTPRKKEE